MRSIRRVLLLWLALLVPLGLVGCPTEVGDPATAPIDSNAVVIGMLQPLATGLISGRELAARLAVQEINAAGGVNGRPLALHVVYDGNSTVSLGVLGAQQLVDSGVVAIIGASSSRVTLPVAVQVTIPADMALISPSATSPLVTLLADNDTVYRIAPSDALQGRLLAERVWAEGHVSAALFAQDEPYGRGLIDAFKARYVALGGSIHAEAVAPTTRNSGFDSEISTLYASGSPPVLMLFAFDKPTSNLLREIVTAKGSLPVLYGVDANMTTATLGNSPSQIVGMRGTQVGVAGDSPRYQRFLRSYVSATGILPSPKAENAYDAVYLVALALTQGGSNDRPSVLANLRAVSRSDGPDSVVVVPGDFVQAVAAIASGADIDYQGASGAIDFDAAGDPSAATYLYQEVQSGPDGLHIVTIATFNYP